MALVHDGRILGIFEGYQRGNLYTLDNGTVWEQVSDRSEYVYRESPRCTLEWNQSIGRYELDVVGTSSVAIVRRYTGRTWSGAGAY